MSKSLFEVSITAQTYACNGVSHSQSCTRLLTSANHNEAADLRKHMLSETSLADTGGIAVAGVYIPSRLTVQC